MQQPVQGGLVLRLKIFEGNVVFLKEPGGGGVDQGRGRARMNERHGKAEVPVDFAQLAQVGQLARASHVTDRRKQRVLHERTQQHIRAEMLRRRRSLLEELNDAL